MAERHWLLIRDYVNELTTRDCPHICFRSDDLYTLSTVAPLSANGLPGSEIRKQNIYRGRPVRLTWQNPWNGGMFILKLESAQVPVLSLFHYEFDRLHFGCCVALGVCIETLGPKKNPRVFWTSQWKNWRITRGFYGSLIGIFILKPCA